MSSVFVCSILRRMQGRKLLKHAAIAGLGICLGLFLCPRGAQAQALSGINGTVTDTSGAVVPGATVTVTNVDTNVSKTAVTTTAGTYYVTDLIPGTYTVKVEKTGFKTFIQKSLTVVGGATSTANASLAPGALSEEVTVTAPSVTLQTEQPQVGTTVNETLLESLPQQISGSNRQIDNFIFLAPGVTGGGFSHRINGGVDQQTEVMFNGVPESWSETAGFTFWNQPPYDSIKDVDVLTGTFSSQYGLGQGVEQYRAKSGTNQIHGDVFGFYRDSYFDAAGAFNNCCTSPSQLGKPNFDHETDWGFSVGGPVWLPKVYNGKDKTFWFLSYDKYRRATAQSPITIPTSAELGGDFSGLVNPSNSAPIPIFVPTAWGTNPSLVPAGCNLAALGYTPGQQFPGNKIDPSCFSSVSKGLLTQFRFPSPTTTSSVINNFVPSATPLNLESDISVNVDHNITSKQAIHGWYWRQNYPQPSNEDWVSSPLDNQFINTVLGRALDVTYSNTLSPNLVVTGGVLYVYQGNDFLPTHLYPGPFPASPAQGISGQPNVLPSINFNGGPWEPQGWGPGNGLSSTINHKTGYSILGNALWQHGRHTINFGVDIRKSYQDDFECGGSGGQPGCAGIINFSSDITANPNEQSAFCGSNTSCVSPPGTNTGNAFASFLLGDATSGGRGGAGNTNLSNSYVAPYFQDDVQINPRWKVNWGVRWDMSFPFTNDFGTNQLTFFDPKVINSGLVNPLNNQPLLGGMAELGPAGADCPFCVGWSHMDMNWHRFSPRAGFTFQLNKKTVLLGGLSWYWLDTGAFEYGVNKVAVNYGNNLNGIVSIGQGVRQVPGLGEWDSNVLPPLPSVPFSPQLFNNVSIQGFAQVHELPRHVNQAYDEQFVLGIQRELPWNMFLSVSAVHTHDLHLPATLESAVQSLSYNFVKQTCPQGPTVTNTADCVLGQPWVSSAAQAFMASQGTFGSETYPAGTCGNSGGPVTLFEPYLGFCTAQAPGVGGAGNITLFQAETPFPGFPFITNNYDTSGADKYNALQLSLQKRTGSGLTFLVSYTLSRYLTNTDSGFSTFNFRGINPQNPNAEWSVGANDQTHVLSMAGKYELPFGPGRKYFNHGGIAMKNLVGGWELSMVNTYSSGSPFSLSACNDQFDCDPLIGNIFVANRPNVVSSNFGVNWNNYYKGLPVINKAAFQFPGDWTIGNMSPLYNGLRGPFQGNEDLSIGKSFFFNERFSAKLSMQWFNVLNRMQVGTCLHGEVTSSQFGLDGTPGQACQGNSPRQGQAEFELFF